MTPSISFTGSPFRTSFNVFPRNGSPPPARTVRLKRAAITATEMKQIRAYRIVRLHGLRTPAAWNASPSLSDSGMGGKPETLSEYVRM